MHPSVFRLGYVLMLPCFCVVCASAAIWFIATAVMWVFLPVVFMPTKMAAPICPWWPSAGIFSTIFLIGKHKHLSAVYRPPLQTA